SPHLSISAPATAEIGVPITVTVTALDSSNNFATNFTGTVQFRSSDRAAILPADYTFTPADQGTKTFSVTFDPVGVHTISVVLTSNPAIVGGAAVIVHAPPSADAGGP